MAKLANRGDGQAQLPPRHRSSVADVPGKAGRTKFGKKSGNKPKDREGARDDQVGDRTGPGAGYDQEPRHEEDEGGVA